MSALAARYMAGDHAPRGYQDGIAVLLKPYVEFYDGDEELAKHALIQDLLEHDQEGPNAAVIIAMREING
jgi:hypothetical protein